MSMDGARASARRNAYKKIRHDCACGRTLRGNLAISHLRACETNLAQRGYPLEQSMQQALRDHYRPNYGIITAVERGLGQIFLNRRRAGNKQPMPWIEYRDTIWQLAEQAEQETGK